MLDSFVALPVAAKVSVAAVPGKGHVFRGLLWRQAERFWYQPGGDFVVVFLGQTQKTSW